MEQRDQLSELDKIKIISLNDKYEHQWTRIANEIGKNKETVRSFYNSFLEHQTINPKRGRPKKITDDVKDGVVKYIENNPTNTLNDVSQNFHISEPSAKQILNENKIYYHKPIATVPLKEIHKTNRIIFWTNYLLNPYPNVIFTDESTVQIRIAKPGIWRRRGMYPPGSFSEKDPHPISVMVWGGIGPRGYRTPLLRFDGSVTSSSYCNSIKKNHIIENINSIFGNTWTWQQDNARPHTAINTKVILLPLMPHLMPWPAKSPDLSPIEQIWAYIKNRLAGRNFQNRDELFDAILFEWNAIPNYVIHNIYQSFWARCIVCINHNGECLNGHWNEVKKNHNTYRTKLYYYTDPHSKIQYVYDL